MPDSGSSKTKTSTPISDQPLFAVTPGYDRRFVGHPMLIGHLSPEDKNAAEVYRLTPSPRRGGVVKFRDERSTAFSAVSQRILL
jgi:hypothetical protein